MSFMTMTKTIRTICYYAVGIVGFFAYAPYAHPQEETGTINVGFIGAFSGSAQAYGDASRNGFELALQELQEKRIKVIYEDDQLTPLKTVSAFNKLLASNDNIDLVITLASGPSSAVAPLAQKKGIALLAWASDRRVSESRPMVIRSYPSGEAEGELAACEAKKRAAGKNIGMLISNNPYCQSWRNGVVPAIGAEGIKMDEELSEDLTDFKPLLLKAKSKGIKAFGICLNSGQNSLFARQAKQILGELLIFGCEYLHDKAEIQMANGALVGSWFATIETTADFRQRYVKKFGNDNVLSGAAVHYDIAYMLSDILKKKETVDLTKALLSLGKRHGAIGAYELKDEGGDRYIDAKLAIKEVTPEGFVVRECN
ncbi:MAG: ABC transporter substrate-binding protein [Deltaproteobacteria bacterium]|nr:ABC transporter substrate-binding protein [Deltaproteobacteria bacterium]